MDFRNLDETRRTLARSGKRCHLITLSERIEKAGKEASTQFARWEVPQSRLTNEDDEDGPTTIEDGHDTGDGGADEPPWLDECMVWLRQRARMFAEVGTRPVKFQVKLFGKGGTYITSGMFVGEPSKKASKAAAESSLDALLADASILGGDGDPLPAFDQTDLPSIKTVTDEALVQAIQLTGAHGAFLHKLVLPTVRVLMAQILQANKSLHLQIAQYRTAVQSAETRIGELREQVRGYELSEKGMLADNARKQKMVSSVVSEAGAVARAWVSVKAGLSAGLVKLVEIIQRDPALMKALEHPNVHALLADPEERTQLREFIEQVAATYAAKKAAAENGSAEGGTKQPPPADTAPGARPESGAEGLG